MQQCEQAVHVALSRGLAERDDDLALLLGRGREARTAGLNRLARPRRVLTGGGRRAAERAGDLVERVPEHVVEHERRALGRRQRLEHDEQGEAHLVAAQGDLLRARVRGHDRLGQPRPDVGLAPHARGLQRVQAEAGDGGDQPPLEVADRVGVDALEPQPRVLQHILGFGDAAELAVRDPQQARAQRLELLDERHDGAPWGAGGASRRRVTT